jgi:hypothetical protein
MKEDQMRATPKLKVRFICFLIFTSLLAVGPFLAIQSSSVQAKPKSRVESWREDIDFLASELPKRHKNLFFQLSESEFKHKIQELKDALSNLSDEEVIWGLSRIVASIGDAHTALQYKTSIAFPFTLYWFKEGIYAVNTVPEYKQILNCRLVQINTFSLEKIAEVLKQGIPHENLAQIKSSIPYHLVMPEYLYGARLIQEKDRAVFTFENEEGKQFRVPVNAVSLKSKPQWIVQTEDQGDLPLYRKNRDKFYSFTYLKDEKTMYVLYNSCRMMKGKLFKDFVKEVFEQVDSNPVDRFIVDLRNNGGGNSMIFYPLLKELKAHEGLNKKDRLFVILGRRTFSSAVLNALQLKNQTNATFLGEPTGGRPNHYGEMRIFPLKNSRLQVSYSTKYFTHSKEDTDSLYPDILVKVSIQDYLKKRDPVLEKILSLSAVTSLIP